MERVIIFSKSFLTHLDNKTTTKQIKHLFWLPRLVYFYITLICINEEFIPQWPGFFLGQLHMGGDLSPPYGRTSAGRQSINGETHEGDIDLMGGPNFDR